MNTIWYCNVHNDYSIKNVAQKFLLSGKLFKGLYLIKERWKQHTRTNLFAKMSSMLTLASGVTTTHKLNIGYSFKGYVNY